MSNTEIIKELQAQLQEARQYGINGALVDAFEALLQHVAQHDPSDAQTQAVLLLYIRFCDVVKEKLQENSYCESR